MARLLKHISQVRHSEIETKQNISKTIHIRNSPTNYFYFLFNHVSSSCIESSGLSLEYKSHFYQFTPIQLLFKLDYTELIEILSFKPRRLYRTSVASARPTSEAARSPFFSVRKWDFPTDIMAFHGLRHASFEFRKFAWIIQSDDALGLPFTLLLLHANSLL